MMAGIVNPRTAASGARTVMTPGSCQQADPPQRDLHHLVDRFRGGKPGETQTAAMGGALDLIGPLRQGLHVAALGERRRRELALDAGFGIPQAGVAGPVRRELLRGEQLEYGAFLVRSLQRGQGWIQR